MAVGEINPAAASLRRVRVSLFYHPLFRAILSQALVAIAIVVFFAWIVDNTIVNLRRANVASGFGFLDARAGFEISQTLIPYTPEDSYGRAFLVGLLNTLLVAGVGIVLATILGFIVGIARLSRNWLIGKIAAVYVETLRNVPVLLQLVFWYRAVLSLLPGPRQGYILGGPIDVLAPVMWLLGRLGLETGTSSLTFVVPTVALNNRGLLLPRPVPGPDFLATLAAFAVAIVAVIVIAIWARRRQAATGRQFPTFRVGLLILIGLPLVVFVLTGSPLRLESPELRGFNFVGGFDITPEFLALTLGLVLYTATYIAEIVRAGILAVAHGQTEAAYSLGLRAGPTLRLIVIPQAMRVIIPPLTNQYLNLTKNSSLAVVVAYPDLVSVFAGTVLNQTGQAVEAIFITMLVYLAISLATSGLMNWFNRRVALVER
jgi:general L-amino acid transport system permease protein